MADVKGPRIRERIKGKAAATVEEATTARKAKRKVGRPQKPLHEEILKLKAFNLPISLIEKIVEYAELHHDGNASAFAKEVFSDFFRKKGIE